MSLDFQRLKKIDETDQLLISGYFREYETVLLNINNNNSYYNIPQLSVSITLLYYAKDYEILQFDPAFKSKDIVLDSNDRVAHCHSSSYDYYHALCGGEVGSATSGIKVWRLEVMYLFKYFIINNK